MLPNKLKRKLKTSKNKQLPEDGQELRSKYVGAVINK